MNLDTIFLNLTASLRCTFAAYGNINSLQKCKKAGNTFIINIPAFTTPAICVGSYFIFM